MRIQSAEVIVTSPDRNFVTLKLTTDDGLTGVGDPCQTGSLVLRELIEGEGPGPPGPGSAPRASPAP